MLPSNVVEVLEYIEPDGRSPYAESFDSLNPPAAAKVMIAAARLAQGNLFNVKSVAGGVHEYRIDFGPVTGCISAGMASGRFCCSVAAPRSDSRETSRMRWAAGWITSEERNWRFDSGSHARFQR